jgi:hypothetical protein
MAYVVTRRGGRFEIRESFNTAKGPRSRTLAGFQVLTDSVMEAAARRAQRPFDAEAVLRSGRRAGARVQVANSGTDRAQERFLAGSRRMASALGRAQPAGTDIDPGTALIELLGFADTIKASQPPRPFEALTFPSLARIVEWRADTAPTNSR